MKYTVRENADHTHTLLRYHKEVPRLINNAELEFWFEIERLREALQAIADRGDPPPGPRAAVCVTTTTLATMAKQALAETTLSVPDTDEREISDVRMEGF